MPVLPHVERHHLARLAVRPTPIQPHRQPLALGRHLQHRPQRAVLHRHPIPAPRPPHRRSTQPALVAQKHDPVAPGKIPCPALGLHRLVFPLQRTRRPHLRPRQRVQIPHVIAGVRQDDPALRRLRLPGRIPPRHQRHLGRFPCVRCLHHPSRAIPPQRRLRLPRRQLPRRLPLPSLTLPPHLGDLRRPMPLRQRPECRPSLDRLQLLGITDQHHLGPRIARRRQHPLHLPRAHHAGLIHHQHVAIGELIPLLPPREFQAGDRARRDTRSRLEPFGRNTRQRHAPNPVARLLPSRPRHREHRALASAGIPHHQRHVGATRDMLQRCPLLRPQHQSTSSRRHRSLLHNPRSNAISVTPCHGRRRQLQPLFSPHHLARRQPLLPACISTDLHQLRRRLDLHHHGGKLLRPIRVPVDEPRQRLPGKR